MLTPRPPVVRAAGLHYARRNVPQTTAVTEQLRTVEQFGMTRRELDLENLREEQGRERD